jgi:hypothetical protein
MINITDVNNRLAEQDQALRDTFSQIARRFDSDPNTQALIEVLGEGLAAIHERQGNLITILLRTNQ